jgi:deoxyribodipyrimidine photo-lyase
MIQKSRIEVLNEKPVQKGLFVAYWMQQSQRVAYNHALEYAIEKANENNVPLLVYFGLTDYPEANARHYQFMLEGLNAVRDDLKARGILFVVEMLTPEKGIVDFANKAVLVVTDKGYLRIQRQWRAFAAKYMSCQLIQVETDVIVPISISSPKQDFSAGTLRPKILRSLKEYLVPISCCELIKKSLKMKLVSIDISDIKKCIGLLAVDKSVKPVDWIVGGTTEAEERLHQFILTRLDKFATLRNEPSLDYYSAMSPYLHFGQISPLYIALEINRTKSDGKDAFLEELIVRRELSMNFVWYNDKYDTFEGLPEWALKTLLTHKKDKRPYVYSVKELESCKTHDPYWNASQKEMMVIGKMHGYMRMYWGKKILEWSVTPEDAYKTALYLNNKYELDGRDANGFTGVAWCFGKHDRAWKERPIFGKIRYMNDKGLERKFNIHAYVDNVNRY